MGCYELILNVYVYWVFHGVSRLGIQVLVRPVFFSTTVSAPTLPTMGPESSPGITRFRGRT